VRRTSIARVATIVCLTVACCGATVDTRAQQPSLEQRQPLELMLADSIVPQDRHELMLTTGGWYSRDGKSHSSSLTQKIEWGISDQLQVSTFVHAIDRTNLPGSTATGFGDVEAGARYSWPAVGSHSFSHIALALDASFPTGSRRVGAGEGVGTVSPSILLSQELRQGRLQLFSTTGIEFVANRHRVDSSPEAPRHTLFSNDGVSARAGSGWLICEVQVASNQWNGGSEVRLAVAPGYVWRFAKRGELLAGFPIGMTSSTPRVGAIFKYTFEVGGPGE
jgi:Putative MetA-pathway of phenol degradation